jgi:hypothetical protein
MKVLLISLEFDCAGVGWGLRNELNRIPGWEAKLVVNRPTVAAPNADHFFRDVGEVVEMAADYDILHFNNWMWTHTPNTSSPHHSNGDIYKTNNPFKRYEGNKQFILHFHRGLLQYDPLLWEEECARLGVRLIKCDPLAPLHRAKWLPNVLDLTGILPHTVPYASPMSVAIYSSLYDSRRTNPGIKVQLDFQGVNHRFFDGIPRDECSRLRQGYNISIDNLTQGFIGMWGWESMAMGQVLLSHVEPETMDAYTAAFGETPPIIHCANIDFVSYYLREFAADMAWFEQLGLQSGEWMRKFYDNRKVAQMYVDFYEGGV